MISDDQIQWRGPVPYDDSLREMESIRDRIFAGSCADARVLLLEHPAVITLGRHAHAANVVLSPMELKQAGIEVREIRRGGDVSYHGPGQLMVYLVMKIEGNISEFLKCVADALASVAMSYGAIGSIWKEDPAGLWYLGRKLAACGLHIQRRVCIHGFTFNLSTPSAAWRAIVPCGLSGPPPISLTEIVGMDKAPSMEDFAQKLTPILGQSLRDYGNALLKQS